MAVTKIIELIGNSSESWEDAARNALATAARSLHGISSIEVVNWSAEVTDGEITEYRATIKTAFVID